MPRKTSIQTLAGCFALLLISCGGGAGSAGPSPGWSADYDRALESAQSSGLPMLVYFTGKTW
jgi:hypothetical protein